MADAHMSKGEAAGGGATSAAAAAGKDGCASGGGSSSSGSGDSGAASRPPLAIGIDLGTTYSCVAVSRNGHVEIIPNKQDERTTASCVAFTTDGRVLLGTPAKEQAESNPRNTVHDSKRLMGRVFADPLLNEDKAHWQFDVIEGEKNMAAIRVQSNGVSKTLAPEQIGAMVLAELKACAETHLGQPVTKAVITCPAYFIGGGTFDVTLLELSSGQTGLYDVKATVGDSHLGGCDLDHLFAKWLANQFQQQHADKDLRTSPATMLSLLHAVESAKCALSSQESATVRVPGVLDGGGEWVQEVTRAQFNELITPKLRVTLEAVDKALKDRKVTKAQVDQIVLAGGSTRIPLLREMVQAHFGGKSLCASINADECVAHGAAVLAAQRIDGSKAIRLKDVAPLSIGIGVKGGIIKVFQTSENDQTSISCPVFEGERKLQSDCHLLGNFTVNGLSTKPKGHHKITVTLVVDRDGLLHASWTCAGQAGSKPIDNPARHDDAAIAKMMSEAEEFAAQDAAAVARIQARLAAWDELDSAIKTCEESYSSIDVRDLKQWAAERSTDVTIKTATIQAQCKRLLDAMEAADAAAAAMDEEEDADAEEQDEGADGGGDDDSEGEQEAGEECDAAAKPAAKNRRVEQTTQAAGSAAEAEPEKEF